MTQDASGHCYEH